MLDNIVAIATILLSGTALYFALKKQGREERNIDADTIAKLYDTIDKQEDRYKALKRETEEEQKDLNQKIKLETEENYCKLMKEFEEYKKTMNAQFALIVSENARLRAWAHKLVRQLEEAKIVPEKYE